MSESTTIVEAQIEGVAIHPLKVLADGRGAVLHMLRGDVSLGAKFGEIYFSEVNPGVVKGWKKHLQMTQRLAVPVGRVQFVIYDGRPGSTTRGQLASWTLGRPEHYRLLVIPPGVWYGFQGIAPGPSLIANCADLPHDPAESVQARLDGEEVPYRW
ncbi:MAG TPA: dTDP-4-dehydrorhamnose 3,5-epimerase family protein [Lacunisphaera sp.]|nr:dTDP-4-dehydrorhamnose 3,5-epimerase family protein [Lacunisphaera sp.]